MAEVDPSVGKWYKYTTVGKRGLDMTAPLTAARLHEVAHKAAEEYFERVYEGIDEWPEGISWVEVLTINLEGNELSKEEQDKLKELGFKKTEYLKGHWYLRSPGNFNCYNLCTQAVAARTAAKLLEEHGYRAFSNTIEYEELITRTQ